MLRNTLRTVLCLLLVLCTAAALPAQAPSPVTLPRPTGEFGVGTVVWHWPDPERLDEITPDAGDVREIMAQAWYPTDAPAAAPTNVYAPLDSSLAHVTGWSRPGAPFSSQIRKAPVIAVCPGVRTSRNFYTAIAEDLASHGYVVLVVDFPRIGFVIYPDGRVLRNVFILPPELQNAPYPLVDQFFETPGALGAGDLLFALESLERISDEDPARRLTGRLDLSRLGAFGHSVGARSCGGAVAASGNRFEAFVTMEGAVPIAVREQGMKAPVLIMLGPGLPERVRNSVLQMIPNRRNDIYLLKLEKFVHNSVSDLTVAFPGLFPSLMDPFVAMEQSREILRTFFGQYVKGTGEDTLSLPSRIPFSTLEHYSGPGKPPSP